AMLAQFFRIVQELRGLRDRTRSGQRHRSIAARESFEAQLGGRAGQAMRVVRVAVSAQSLRQLTEAREEPVPVVAALGETARLEDHRNDFLEIAAGHSRARGFEKRSEVIERRRIPCDARRVALLETRCEIFEVRLFPGGWMPPRMRIVEKEIGDEERRPAGPPERQLFERSPSDEDPPRRGLDEGEVALRHAGGI